MPDIVVTAKYINDEPLIEAWTFESGGYEPYDFISPIPQGLPPEYISFPLQIECNSPEKLAKAVADYMGSDLIQAHGNEFSMAVVGVGGGIYKLFNDDIKTIFEVDRTVLVYPVGMPTAIPLVFHNHPPLPDANYNALNRYPSARDWASVTSGVETGNLLPNVKLAIAASSGSVRIYNYADKAY